MKYLITTILILSPMSILAGYKEEFNEKQFNHCLRTQPKSFCDCVYKEVDKELKEADLVEIEENWNKAVFQSVAKQLEKMVEKCAKEYTERSK